MPETWWFWEESTLKVTLESFVEVIALAFESVNWLLDPPWPRKTVLPEIVIGPLSVTATLLALIWAVVVVVIGTE